VNDAQYAVIKCLMQSLSAVIKSGHLCVRSSEVPYARPRLRWSETECVGRVPAHVSPPSAPWWCGVCVVWCVDGVVDQVCVLGCRLRNPVILAPIRNYHTFHFQSAATEFRESECLHVSEDADTSVDTDTHTSMREGVLCCGVALPFVSCLNI